MPTPPSATLFLPFKRCVWLVAALVTVAGLAACAAGNGRAPVEAREVPVTRPVIESPSYPQRASGTSASNRPPVVGSASRPSAGGGGGGQAPVVTPVPAATVETGGGADKPGYYTVKPGDNLYRIGLETGQHWKDLARWNGLPDGHQIAVGQVLRVIPPGETPSTDEDAGEKTASAPPAASTPTSRPVTSVVVGGEAASSSGLTWIWPVSGPVLASFDGVRNKGLDIGGTAGEPVLAAADGRVVYSGSGLRGYGNLIIIKHNNTYLTAYAHNRALLVKEDQTVKRGQKIAEMGNSDADRVKLHFEVRRQGKPVNPAQYLPKR
ncbi:LysM peptidoglycan-binding domain-containing protein [Hylemonella gracilis]|uniref:LysM peptidoglycan-binding domain-containing protein n=2 Tax=Hylemonella gracilis TaxID=80880 RepID=A0A4P6UP52_9BURK|nr:LysM peptidoglycan-binding domain-containing protein [Hylemonella gracilis]